MGTYTFRYTIDDDGDGNADSGEATVTIIVTPVNDPPVNDFPVDFSIDQHPSLLARFQFQLGTLPGVQGHRTRLWPQRR